MRFIIPFILILMLGCSSQVDQVVDQGVDQVVDPVEPEEVVPDEPVITQEPASKPAVENISCDTPADPSKIVDVEYSLDSEGITQLTDGFSFTFRPIDSKGNTVPAEGNLGLALYWTDKMNGVRRGKTVVYEQAKYIKPEDMNPDCSPQPIVVKYENILKDRRFDGIKEDDPGFMKVIFKKVGSFEEYSDEYMPGDGKRLFP